MEAKKNYKYKFSIVMAIYNVEKYLEEAILSVVNQDIGFEESVQLILINDGSNDNSNVICERYKALYPNNIVYIEKENGGVSSARNEGMKYVEGKYMNFLDGDDKFSDNTFSKVFDLFEQVYNFINVVSVKLVFFDGKSGEHILNYKYKKTRQINLFKEYDMIQLSSSSAFIKSELKDEIKFDINMKYAEDAEVISKILLKTGTLGVVADCTYFYRRRQEVTSAIQQSTYSKEWYSDYMENFALNLINYSLRTVGYVPNFIQYTIMYELQWRFNIDKINEDILCKEEQVKFFDLLKTVLKYIDDDIIIQQKNISLAHKKYILEVKENTTLDNKLMLVCSPENIDILYKENVIGSIYNERMKIDFVDIENGILKLEGCVTKTLKNIDYIVEVELNNKVFVAENINRNINNIKSLGHTIKSMQGFKIEIPLDKITKEQTLKVYLKVNESRIRLKLNLGKFVKLNQELKNSYFTTDPYVIVYKYNSIVILKKGIKVNFGREYRLMVDLLKLKEFKSILIRLMYFFCKLFKKKEVWIFMDRINKADENAEHLFKYSVRQNDGIKKYFVISSECGDFERLKEYGKVIPFNSNKHKWLLLFTDKVISSQAEDGIRVPFMGKGRYLRSLINFKFIFLQHGIIKDDLSTWLNKYNKNLDMFVTSVNKEYESILEGDYFYDESVVKLTGLPRYDNLNDASDKQILIMPTWRKNLTLELDQNTGLRVYNISFKKSLYFKTYYNLINNQDLIDIAKKEGYKIKFFLHPSMHQQLKDFLPNENVIIPETDESYQKMFNESSLLITDYSSVAFDFAYMKKPVIYYQFDRETFFKGHTYTEGYFDYEKMGMGPVINNQDDLIECIEGYLKSDCIISEKYKKRVENFYRYTDKDNCKRVYKEICEL